MPAESDPPTRDQDGNDPPFQADEIVVRFEELARCGNEVWIRNRGQLYRLQQTRQGKLILTK